MQTLLSKITPLPQKWVFENIFIASLIYFVSLSCIFLYLFLFFFPLFFRHLLFSLPLCQSNGPVENLHLELFVNIIYVSVAQYWQRNESVWQHTPFTGKCLTELTRKCRNWPTITRNVKLPLQTVETVMIFSKPSAVLRTVSSVAVASIYILLPCRLKDLNYFGQWTTQYR